MCYLTDISYAYWSPTADCISYNLEIGDEFYEPNITTKYQDDRKRHLCAEMNVMHFGHKDETENASDFLVFYFV